MSKQAHLLVVDDDNVTRLTLYRVLLKAGYLVNVAKDGNEALLLLRHLQPDMVLMDVMMPGLDGYESCRRIRAFADHQDLPVLMLTALNDTDSIDKAFDSGATDFVTKPINWNLLLQRVRYALRVREMGAALKKHQERLAQAQRIARLGYCEIDLPSLAMRCSAQLHDMLQTEGHWSQPCLEDLLTLVVEEDRAEVRQAIERAIQSKVPYQIVHRIRRRSGETLYVQQLGEFEEDKEGNVVMMSTLQDISEQKRAEALIEYQANYDNLTGLLNRDAFFTHVERSLASSDSAIFFLGLDRFKVINDSLGHSRGDRVLEALARRLQKLGRDGFTVARFGGDLFALQLESEVSDELVDRMAARLLDMVARPLQIDEQDYFITASIGISLFPHDGREAGALLKAADIAMSRSKELGGNRYSYYTEEMNADAQMRLRMEGELRRAIDAGEFFLAYQPQVNAAGRNLIGMEALIRWNHPEHGLIQPDQFIPIAEENGLIVPIGNWVLEQACRQTLEWNRRFGLALIVGINLSAKQFAEPTLVADVARIIEEVGIPPAMVELEVTETVVLQDIDSCVETLDALRGLGVSCAMDDFGTGYSSLGYLQRLPLDTLKIDRTFIKDIGDNGENGSIARAVIAMAHSLDLEVVAEGVDSEGQYRFLQGLGCDVIQGYLVGKPLDPAAFEAFVER